MVEERWTIEVARDGQSAHGALPLGQDLVTPRTNDFRQPPRGSRIIAEGLVALDHGAGRFRLDAREAPTRGESMRGAGARQRLRARPASGTVSAPIP